MSRLDHLEGGAKDLVKRASVLGIRFWSEALGELGCKSPAHTIRKLVRTGMVVRPARRDVRLSGFDEYGFRQRVVRDVAYGILTPDQRRVLHLAAGRWLSSVEAALPKRLQAIRYGGDTQAAAEWWARAAEAALARGDTRMSFEWFDRAVSGMSDPQRVTELRLKKVEGYYAANGSRGAESELAQIDLDILEPAPAGHGSVLEMSHRDGLAVRGTAEVTPSVKCWISLPSLNPLKWPIGTEWRWRKRR